MSPEKAENSEKKEETAQILTLMAHRGFIWGPSPEIYNPVKGSFEFGPLGKQMKNHLEIYIRKKFRKFDFWEVQCPLISPEIVWQASGHAERFFDYITQCQNPKCTHIFRVDTMLEGMGMDITGFHVEDFDRVIRETPIQCPDCQGSLSSILTQNLMVTSKLGFPASDYILRPETATTTYLTFPRLYTFFRTVMPISIFQMGYAFRNEISPRNMLLRTREFEQVEGQIFITPEQEMQFEFYDLAKDQKLPLWSAKQQEAHKGSIQKISLEKAIADKILQKPAYAWLIYFAYELVKGLKIPEENIRFRQHRMDERAHYAHDAWDLEIKSKLYGWTEVCGIHDRGNYDLGRHFEYSKKNSLQIPSAIKGEKTVPHILEIAFGVGRLFFFTLEQAFKFEAERTVLDLPIEITPVPFAVFPLQKKPHELITTAREIYADLIDNDINAIFDDTGSIGKRYRRTEEVGVRYAFTIDHQTLSDGTLTIRNIENMAQKRISRQDLVPIALQLLHGQKSFESISGDIVYSREPDDKLG